MNIECQSQFEIFLLLNAVFCHGFSKKPKQASGIHVAEGRQKCILALNHLVIYSGFNHCENTNRGILNEL